MEFKNGDSPDCDKKTPPRRRLVQSTLFPHKSQGKVEENINNCEEKEVRGEEFGGSESNGKRKRKAKGESEVTPPTKTPTTGQEALAGMIESQNLMLDNGLQIDLMVSSTEAGQIVTNGISPHSEKKTPCRRLIQSTLFPRIFQENGGENNNEEEEEEDKEHCESHSKGKWKRKGNGESKCTPAKNPINIHEALVGTIENNDSLLTNGLQIDLMERCAEAVEQVIVNGISSHYEKKTPRRRLIQSTLFPHSSQENEEENNNEEEEKDEDEEYCGSKGKGKQKKKGKGKTKRTPTAKTPNNCQDALSGRIDSKNSPHTKERKLLQKQQKDKKVVDSPDQDEKTCIDLESGPCKRSRRQLKKGQKDDSPHKSLTPRKLKGPHCRRIMTDINSKDVDIQNELATEIVIDLRLEAKVAAEENALLFKGRQTHPFFSSWKVGKKNQGTSEATEPESKQCSILHEGQSFRCHPIHVFEMHQDDPIPLDWSNWTFCDESSLDSSHNLENGCSSTFNDSVKPLNFDSFLTTSEPVGVSLPENGISLKQSSSKIYSNSPTVPFIDGRMPHHQMEYLQADHERYPGNSLDTKMKDKFVEESRMKLYYHEHGPENSLWANKYQPRKASEVCGNGDSVRFLNEWLSSWRERYSRNPNKSRRDNTCIIEDSDYCSEESDSDAESMEERADTKNVLLVSGPVGSGKSAAIYACAREQGFQVIEVNASDWRNGAQIKQKFGAAMESLGLNKWSSEDSLDLRMKHLQEISSTQPCNSSIREFVDDMVEVFPETCKEESDSFIPEPGNVVVKDNSTASSRGADMTLILFEDVDIVFDEDRGLIASIQQIAETAKRPIILTSNRKDPDLPDQLDRLEVCFTIPSPEDLVSQMLMVCSTEQANIDPELLHRIIRCCQGDIRKTLILLQFWCQGKMNKNDRKTQSRYDPPRFDLEAGHRVIPKVIPWGFPCQLSELVEEEIAKSLSMLKENASLLDIVEEEDLNPKEPQETLGINMEAKKEAMLSRNYSVHVDNEFPVQLDNLEDFSNSAGSPVPFTRGPARRRLCTVLSSQSEDEFCTDNIPKDSNYLSVDLCHEVLPDVSHRSLADTIAVQDYQGPHTGQLHHSEREMTTQNLFDWFPTETDQRLCETYKSVDISCVPESSFVPETEINDGVELLSTVSCGHTAVMLETMHLSNGKSVESMSIIDVSSLHDTLGGMDSETILRNTCEVDAVSFHSEEIGDSQHQHAESVTRRYQVMDECSRAGFNATSISWENPRSSGQASSVPETWRRLRCCHGDLKSYVTAEQRNASQIVKFTSGLTDLLSLADLMFGRCQPLISDFLEPSMVPCAEPDAFCWYDEHLEMASTIAQHGFCFFANESAARGSDPGFKVGVDLASEILASTTNTTVLGKLLRQNLSMSQYSFSRRDLETRLSRCDISLKRGIETQFYNVIKNVVPSKMYLALKAAAFHEYMSSLGRISKLEASRLSKNIDKTKLRRRARVARHYLSTGSLALSPDDVTLLSQHSCFGKIQFK